MWLAVLTLVAAAVATPFANAETFVFDFLSQNGDFSAQGTLTASQIGDTGVWNITSLTGAFTDTDNGLDIVDQVISLYPDGTTPQALGSVQGTITGYETADGAEVYDNLLYYPAGTYYNGSYYPLDGGGLVFYTGILNGAGYEVGIALGENANSPQAGWVNITGSAPADCSGEVSNGVCFVDYGTSIDNGVPLDESVDPDQVISAAPEPSSLLMLGCGLALLALGLFSVARRHRTNRSAS
jgi:hypothetical protein